MSIPAAREAISGRMKVIREETGENKMRRRRRQNEWGCTRPVRLISPGVAVKPNAFPSAQFLRRREKTPLVLIYGFELGLANLGNGQSWRAGKEATIDGGDKDRGSNSLYLQHTERGYKL